MKKIALIIPIVSIAIPNLVFAVTAVDLIEVAFNLIRSTLVPLAYGLCLLYFFWGVAKYIRSGAGSEEAAKEGRRIMLWGIAGLFIVFSIWGIIKLIQSELMLPSIQNVERPSLPNINSSFMPLTN
jgi:hypothetical protein